MSQKNWKDGKKEANLSLDSGSFPSLKRLDKSAKSKFNNKIEYAPVFSKSWLRIVSAQEKIHLKDEFPSLGSVKKNVKSTKKAIIGENWSGNPLSTASDIADHFEEEKLVNNFESSGNIANDKKKFKATKNITLPQKNPNKKKRSDPIYFNLGEVLEVNKIKKKGTKGVKSKFQRCIGKEHLSGNILDSSNPKRNRGKHREIKKKKLSKLKLVIIKERILKKKLRESSAPVCCVKEFEDSIKNLNLKNEIENYLNDSDKRKNQRGSNNNNKITKTIDNKGKNKPEVEKNKLQSHSTDKTDECSNHSVDKIGSDEKPAQVKELRFNSKLREYCDNIVTPGLNTAVYELIRELVNLQDRAFSKDPIKAKARRRHVSGIKEVKKHLTMKKVKMVIIAPNLEQLKIHGSVYDLIYELKSLAKIQNVPCVFALDRIKLGRCAKKNVPISAFAVLNYQGIEDRFNNVLVHLGDAKKQFESMLLKFDSKSDFQEHSELAISLLAAFKEKLNVSIESTMKQFKPED